MRNFRRQKSVDSFCRKINQDRHFDWPLVKLLRNHKNSAVLFSKYGRVEYFSTSNLNIHFLKSDYQPNFRSLDGFLKLEKRIPVKYAVKNRKDIYNEILEKYGDAKNYFLDVLNGSAREMSLVKVWNVSIVGSVVFGMFLMTFIYRHLGQGASAVSMNAGSEKIIERKLPEGSGVVLGEEAELSRGGEVEDYVSQIMKDYAEKSKNRKELEDEIREMVKGYPIEKMASFIAKEDRIVAAFLVGIAKKESNWGKRVPVLNGRDCYNYWGYRGKRKRMGTGGHTCFDSPRDAVETVAKRLEFLVSNEKITTPDKMVVVWKCGYDCSWDNPAAVRKWVSDVDMYFKELDE